MDRMKRFIFGEEAGRFTGYDTAIVVFLAIFLLSSPFSIAVMNISYGVAAALWIGRMIARRKSEWPRTPLDWFFVAYICTEALATIFAYDREQSLLYMYRRVTLIPIVYVILANINTRRTLAVLSGSLVCAMLAVSLWGLRDVFIHFQEYVLFTRRLREFQMYMTAGGMMMIAMLLLLPLAIHARTPNRLRWFALAAMVPVAANLLFTFTRSSWLGFLAGAVVIGGFRSKKIFIPIVLLIAGVVVTASPEMQDRISSIFNPYHPNNISRLRMWETGLKIFADNPVFGVGDIGIEKVWPQYAPPEWQPEGHLHNNLIMWLVTLGVVGFSALVALFVKTFGVMGGVERRLHADWLGGSVALSGLAIMAGFHVNGLFEWNFGDAEIIMVVWAVLGLTLAAGKIGRAEETRG